MRHLVCGSMDVNGQEYSFQNEYGYWEGDEGHSFPKEYAWTQCSFPGGSLMLSVADVPIVGFHLRGIISAVLWKGKEYRLATVRSPLKAPIHGDMARTIHENAACQAFFKFRKGDCILFAFETNQVCIETKITK